MKVLFVCQNPVDSYAGGVQHITYELSRFLLEKGIESIFLSVSNVYNNVIENNFYFPNNKNLQSKENKKYFSEIIADNGINLIINQCGIDLSLSKLIFDSALGRPVITCFHNSLLGGIDNFYHLHQSKLKRLGISRNLIESRPIKHLIRSLYIRVHKNGYKKICRESAKVILLTNSMLSELNVFVDRSNLKNVEIIPNFISSTFPVQKKEKVVAYVGRVDLLYKQTDLAISIWEDFSQIHPDYRFYVVGDGKDLSHIKELAAKKKLRNIYFEGQRNPKQYYDRAAMLVFTSCSESFGLVLIEAMAHGVVPIAFDSYNAIHEIIDDGVNGCLIEPFDVRQFSNAMSMLVEDKERYNQMSKSAIDKSGVFSNNVVIEKWLKIIENVK